MTDETIYMIAHRDAWFEGASDDASGVATMLGLAEYFAKIPKEKRRRTIVFLGTHRTSSRRGRLGDRQVAGCQSRTVLREDGADFINCEHTATTPTLFHERRYSQSQ